MPASERESGAGINTDASKPQNGEGILPQTEPQTTTTVNPAIFVTSPKQAIPNNYLVSPHSNPQAGVLLQQPLQQPINTAIPAAPGQAPVTGQPPSQFFMYNGQLIPISALQPVSLQPTGVNVSVPPQQPQIINSHGVSLSIVTAQASATTLQSQQQKAEQKPIVSPQRKVEEAQVRAQTQTASSTPQAETQGDHKAHENKVNNTTEKTYAKQGSQEGSIHPPASVGSTLTTQSPSEASKKEKKRRSLFGSPLKMFNEMKQALKFPQADNPQGNEQSDNTNALKTEVGFVKQLTKGVEDLVRRDKNTSAQTQADTYTDNNIVAAPVQSGYTSTAPAAQQTSNYTQYPDNSGYSSQVPTVFGSQDQRQSDYDTSGGSQPQNLILQGYQVQAEQFYGTLTGSATTGWPSSQSADYGNNATGAYAVGVDGQGTQDQTLASGQRIQTPAQGDPSSIAQDRVGAGQTTGNTNTSDTSNTVPIQDENNYDDDDDYLDDSADTTDDFF
ncbi:hypothetical protein BGW36DRAFT_426167 [Talaromyces proteolyticus]|uniref:Uncharacterized protein n=1 Tax=Talaromyces proteolyticus TaxID=1131652 RepID=A0AAD4Q1G8_9EURO|nr:uncharacterized protein BGW36DRAFT_426167 [Talaromyces proteolyticus]KAH8698460.1 hypothetical protein BGW36DRAFT_426167 [Talaromyces proteolyticus]